MLKNTTIVTGLWDLKRGNLEGWAKRDFDYYKNNFFTLLEVDTQMCVWIPKELEKDVIERRRGKPTRVYIKENIDFETWNPFFDKIQKIRENEDWLSQADWLRESPQALLKYYNAMMFTKMFMVNDSAIMNPFDSDYFFWIDGGLTSTVSSGYFLEDKVLDNLENYLTTHNAKYLYLTFPYEGNSEIHGFERTSLAKYCNTDFVRYVARGGFFGGHKQTVHRVNSLYYDILNSSLRDNLMGADECIFTILCYLYSDFIHQFKIKSDGLVWPFFEELKKYKTLINNKTNTGLYVISYNSPKQFQTLIESIKKYDNNFLNKTTKFLLDNSTDKSTFKDYSKICAEYNFEHIKKDNLGICGGRQFIAEHFEGTELDYMFFFEDDMFFYSKEGELCKNGFNRYIKNLYVKILNIMAKEDYDFLKLSFTEFYGDNSTQWAWYNVPQEKREEYWPGDCKLPEHGLDKNSPRTIFRNIKSFQGLPYADGEIYYSNWPQIITKEANKKMFLDTKWAHPFEQTWMSHFFQMTKRGELNPAILLLSPIEHDRFDHYDSNLRKES